MSNWLTRLFGRGGGEPPAPPREPAAAPTPLAALATAVCASDTEAAKRLFAEYPEQLAVFTPFGGGTWLHYAAGSGAVEIVAHLLSLGVDVNVGDSREGRTALCSAASNGHLAVATLLLDNGARLDADEPIRNPLFACIGGYRGIQDEPRQRFADVADLLIRRGIDLTACYTDSRRVDMDAAAFAHMFGRTDIADAVIAALYGQDERLVAGAHAEAIEVAVGNAFSRERFRKWRYPSKRADPATLPPPGEFWS